MTDPEELERIRREKIAEMVDDPDAGTEGNDPAGDGPPDDPVHVEDSDHLADLVERHDVVLADFYADWCGPCKALEPILLDVAAESRAAVAKVDVDEHQALAGQYGVRGVPTLVLFADGEQVEQVVGVQQKDALLRLIDRHAA